MTSRRECGKFWSWWNERVQRVVRWAGGCREGKREDAQGVGRGGQAGGEVVVVVWDVHQVASCLLGGGS